MKIETKQLIEDLLEMTDKSSRAVEKLKMLRLDQLNFKKNPKQWSALECIEHLNLYGDFYLPEIEKQLLGQKPGTGSPVFRSGWIGNYFANLMRADNGKMTKMKSPKDKNPANSELSITTLDRFLKQQERLKSLLRQSSTVNLTTTKVSISLTKLIKLRLGDTFRFFVYHIDRHIQQAERTQA
jgi:hypothetical protein